MTVMFTERDRAYRRSQTKRFKNKTKKIAKSFSLGFKKSKQDALEYEEDWANRNFNNRQPCSCDACGNPRKHFNEPTIQEKRAFQDDNDVGTDTTGTDGE